MVGIVITEAARATAQVKDAVNFMESIGAGEESVFELIMLTKETSSRFNSSPLKEEVKLRKFG
jgi:hypothetical protein